MKSQVYVESSNGEQIKAKCDELFARGEKMTVRSIHQYFPSIKSTSTIHEYFKEWKDARRAEEAALFAHAGGLSEEFQAMFVSEIRRFSAKTIQHFEDIANDSNIQCSQAVDDLVRSEAQVADLFESNDALKAEIALLTSKASEFNSATDSTVRELRQQITDLKLETQRLVAASEELKTDLAVARSTLEINSLANLELRDEKLELHEELKAQRAVVLEYSSQISHYRTESESLMLRVNQYELGEARHMTALEQAHSTFRLDLHEMQKRIDQLHNDLKISNSTNMALEKQLIIDKQLIAEQSSIIEKHLKDQIAP